MRKLMKLMTITAITSISTMQVVACKDDSLNEQFLKDVDDSERNSDAFLGFLGSADNDTSKDLYNIFDFLNKKDDQGSSPWERWNEQYKTEIKSANLNKVYLNAYQGPAHDPVPSDPIASFWNDKNITWQKNIFNWVYSRTKDNTEYHSPQGFTDITEISVVKDNNQDRFQNLPIIFIVKKGHLITAGEKWIPENNDNWPERVSAVGEFILQNLLL